MRTIYNTPHEAFCIAMYQTNCVVNCQILTRKKQSNAERLMRCIKYSPHWLRTFYRALSMMQSVYVHWRGAVGVARFDKLGDARASTRGTCDRIGSTLFRMYNI